MYHPSYWVNPETGEFVEFDPKTERAPEGVDIFMWDEYYQIYAYLSYSLRKATCSYSAAQGSETWDCTSTYFS